MSNEVNYKEVIDKKDFWIYFIMSNFPEGIDNDTDENIMEIISSKFSFDSKWVNEFTKYYKGVFDENDGYVSDPNILKIELSYGEVFSIEFHPGDTLYYINEKKIGATGAEYFIRQIDWENFKKYTVCLINKEKLLLLPMLRIKKEEIEEFREFIFRSLKLLNIFEGYIEKIVNCIVENCIDI